MSARADQKRSLRLLLLNERDGGHPRAGGAEIHVERIFSRLAARGHRIVHEAAGFPGGAPSASHSGIEVHRRGPLAAYYASLPFRLAPACRRGEFDVVVECLNKIPYYAPVWAGIPVLALCHHLFGEVAFEQAPLPIAAAVWLAERGLPVAYRRTDFLAISPSTRDDLVARGIPAARIRTSLPGIDRPSRPGDPDSPRGPRIAYVGRLEAYKRIDSMLEAAALLVARHPALEILVVGRGSERGRLEARAQRLGIAGRTRFTGFVDDRTRDDLVASASACVFASQKEGFGLTVIEANALATPVVARDAPGLRDSIRHGETGLLVGGDDPAAWASAIAPLLEQTPATVAMRRAALAWSDRFDWERASDEVEAAIFACVERRSR